MNTKKLIDRREKVLGPGYFHFFDNIMHLVKGEGMWVWDSEDNKYLDFYNNVPSVGHCHPDVIGALVQQASQINVGTRYLHESIVEFAEALTSKLPDNLNNCVFACTGTEANDLAIQMARHITGNQGVLVAEYAYHGNSDLVVSVSSDSTFGDDRPDWMTTFAVPDPYRGIFHDKPGGQAELYLAQACEQLDKMESRGHKPAALLIDCSFEAYGLVKAPQGYMNALCEEVRRRGGLIIADEVQCGYCRMGSHWWGFEHYGITPDIVTCGKAMGAGHPVSVVVSSREHAEHFTKRNKYFNTTAGNPVSSAVGKAVIDVIDREGLLNRVTDSGAYMSCRLHALQEKHSIIGAVSGYGLFQGLDIVSDPDTKKPITPDQLCHLSTQIAGQGLLTGTSGKHGNVLKIRPPLQAQREHVDLAVAALDRALSIYAEE